eukprot:5773370-Prymnesium_polylepis.1
MGRAGSDPQPAGAHLYSVARYPRLYYCLPSLWVDETVEIVSCANTGSNGVVSCVRTLTRVINGPCLIVFSRISDDHRPDF